MPGRLSSQDTCKRPREAGSSRLKTVLPDRTYQAQVGPQPTPAAAGQEGYRRWALGRTPGLRRRCGRQLPEQARLMPQPAQAAAWVAAAQRARRMHRWGWRQRLHTVAPAQAINDLAGFIRQLPGAPLTSALRRTSSIRCNAIMTACSPEPQIRHNQGHAHPATVPSASHPHEQS